VGPRQKEKPKEDMVTPATKALSAIAGGTIGFVAGGPAGAVKGAQAGSMIGELGGALAAEPGSEPSAGSKSFMDLLDFGLGAASRGMEPQPAMQMPQGTLQKMLMGQAGPMPDDLLAPEGMSRDQHWANMVSADPFIKVREEQRAWEEDPENKFASLEEWMTERDFDPSSATARYEQMPSYAAAKMLHHSKSPFGRLEQSGYSRPPEDYISPESIWSHRAPAEQPPPVRPPVPEVPSPGLGEARLRSRRDPEPMAPLGMPQRGVQPFARAPSPLDLQSEVYRPKERPELAPPGDIPMNLQSGVLGPQALRRDDAATQAQRPPGADAMLESIGMTEDQLEMFRRGRQRLGMSFGIPGGFGGTGGGG
jgi:hypothetical protein